MSALARTVAMAAVFALVGCLENAAPGNDREAALDAPESGARVMPAAEALRNVDPGLLQPEIMSDADLASLPRGTGSCRFRMTRVGFPVLAYGGSGPGVVKLNTRLVPLPAAGEGRYASEGVEVTVRPLEDNEGEEGLEATELVLRFADAPHERGYHGYAEC